MMAYKNFTPTVLSSSEVQTYLMNQSVMVFANSTARSAALTSPSEGMLTYLQDVNEVQMYDGSAWVGLKSSTLTAGSANVLGTIYSQALISSPSTTGAGLTLQPSGSGAQPWSIISTGSAATQGAGAFLIYRNNTDGGSASLRIDSSGRVFTPYQPAFHAFATTGQTPTGSSPHTIMVFQSAQLNRGNAYNTSTGLFTAPVTAVYWLETRLLSNYDATNVDARFIINGVLQNAYAGIQYVPAVANFHKQQVVQAAISLTAGDTVGVGVFTTVAVYGSPTYGHSAFTGFMLG